MKFFTISLLSTKSFQVPHISMYIHNRAAFNSSGQKSFYSGLVIWTNFCLTGIYKRGRLNMWIIAYTHCYTQFVQHGSPKYMYDCSLYNNFNCNTSSWWFFYWNGKVVDHGSELTSLKYLSISSLFCRNCAQYLTRNELIYILDFKLM